jgi:hypothetical protein
MAGPLRGGRAGDPETPTINARKHRWRAPLGGGAGARGLKAPTNNARKCRRCHPGGGADAGDPGAFTINARKYRRRALWEAAELEV